MPTRIRQSWGLEGSRKLSPMLFSRKVGFQRVFSDSGSKLGFLFSWGSAPVFFLQSFGNLPVNVFAVLRCYLIFRGGERLAKSSRSFCSGNILFVFLLKNKSLITLLWFPLLSSWLLIFFLLFTYIILHLTAICVTTLKHFFFLFSCFSYFQPWNLCFYNKYCLSPRIKVKLDLIPLNILLRNYANENSIHFLLLSCGVCSGE